MAKEKTVNYTPEMEATVRSMYAELHPEQGNACLDEIAKAVNRTRASVRSKLVLLKEYIKDEQAPKTRKDEGPMKKELLNELEQTRGFDAKGLEGATKEAIQRLIDALPVKVEPVEDSEPVEADNSPEAEAV